MMMDSHWILFFLEVFLIKVNVSASAVNSYWSVADNCPFSEPCYCSGSRIICQSITPIKDFSMVSTKDSDTAGLSWHELRIRIPLMNFLPKLSDNLRVKVLNVTHSNLTEISPSVFMPFILLERIHLSNNQITRILRGQLVGLESLKELRLHHNEIFHIDEDAFKYLIRLKQLFLNNNYLTSVPQALLALKSLTHLYLSGNPIQRVDSFAFRGLHRLISLDLSKLKPGLQFEPDSFCGIEKESTFREKPIIRIHFGLKFLFMMQNDIVTFPPCVLHAMTSTLLRLDLSDSQMHCDLSYCDNLSGLARKMSRSHFQFYPPRYECLTVKQLPQCNLTQICATNCHLRVEYASNINQAPDITSSLLLVTVLALILVVNHS